MISETISHYRILSKLGAGGMGEVYLAQDTKLDRKVALKILPAEVAAHPDRMRRFVQEAKAASALNHPNILTIYEIEQIDSTHFIATEFIDGETLRSRLSRAPGFRIRLQLKVRVTGAQASPLATGATALATLATFLTGTRAAYLGLAAGGVVGLSYQRFRITRRMTAATAVLLLALMLVQAGCGGGPGRRPR